MTDGGTGGASVAEIGEIVDMAVERIATERRRAILDAAEDPCVAAMHLGMFVRETSEPRLRMIESAAGQIAAGMSDAIERSIRRWGRDGPGHVGGVPFADYLINQGIIPPTPGPVLLGFIGGPAALGAGMQGWIQNHLPEGGRKPPAGGSGYALPGATDIYVGDGLLRGPGMVRAWESWILSQRQEVCPEGRTGCRQRIARLVGRVDWQPGEPVAAESAIGMLRAQIADADRQIKQWDAQCLRERAEDRADVDADRVANLLRDLAPWAAAIAAALLLTEG